MKITENPVFWKHVGTGIMFVFYLVFAFLNMRNGGVEAYSSATKGSLKMARNMLPDLLLMFALSGQVGTYIMSNYGADLKGWIDGTGVILRSLVASTFSPSSISALPIVRGLWYNDVADKLYLIFFIVISGNLGWQIILIRAPMVTWKVYGWAILANLLLSMIACVLMVIILRVREFLSLQQMVASGAGISAWFAWFMWKFGRRPEPPHGKKEEVRERAGT